MDKSDLSLSLSLKLKNSKFMQTIPTNHQFKETPLNNVHYKRYTMLVTANLIYYYLFFPFLSLSTRAVLHILIIQNLLN